MHPRVLRGLFQLTACPNSLHSAALALGMGGVMLFTHAHPYLLADNRHYTFYIWRKVFMRHELVKYAFVPGNLNLTL